MNTQHTQGPWFIERRTDDNETTCYWVTASDGSGWSGNRYMSVSGCIDEHDARLIAAAPELLEALTVIQSQFENIASADWRKWEELASPEEFERWVKSRAAHMAAFARAAIAKATGEIT